MRGGNCCVHEIQNAQVDLSWLERIGCDFPWLRTPSLRCVRRRHADSRDAAFTTVWRRCSSFTALAAVSACTISAGALLGDPL